MPAKPIQISIDTDLLRRIDRDREVKERGRSAFVRSAVELYLEAKRRRWIDSEIQRAYEGQADPMLDEIEEIMGEKAWPES